MNGDVVIPCQEISSPEALCRHPLVSVVMLAYNHAAYIREALEGVLMQETDFAFELLVGEDCSTDETRAICLDYQRRHPDRLRVLTSQENVSLGISGNLLRVCRRCRGTFVAMCEGDDCWTDRAKLKKQVAYMKAHPDCTVCFHPARVVWGDGDHPDSFVPAQPARYRNRTIRLAELLHGNFIPTSGVLYRWNADGRLFDEFPVYALPGDWLLHLLHARAGTIGFLDETMSIYRRNKGSVWSGDWIDEYWFERLGLRVALFYATVERLFHVSRGSRLVPLVLATAAILLERIETPRNAEKLSRLWTIRRPAAVWVRLSPLLALVGRVLVVLAPSALRPAFARRFTMWQIVAARRKLLLPVLRERLQRPPAGEEGR